MDMMRGKNRKQKLFRYIGFPILHKSHQTNPSKNMYFKSIKDLVSPIFIFFLLHIMCFLHAQQISFPDIGKTHGPLFITKDFFTPSYFLTTILLYPFIFHFSFFIFHFSFFIFHFSSVRKRQLI